MAAIGVSPTSIHKLKHGLRLNDDVMRRLKDCVEVDDATGKARIDPNMSGSEQMARLQANMTRHKLNVIHDAMAKGKDFDLSADARRNALANVRRGPVPLYDVGKAIERHLDAGDKAARKALENGIGDAWIGEPEAFRGFPQIEEAIELAAGGKRKRARRERVKVKMAVIRTDRKTKIESGFVDHPPIEPVFPLRTHAQIEDGPWRRFATLPDEDKRPFPFSSHAFWTIAAAITWILVICALPNEAETALRKAVRRAMPETVWHEFFAAFMEPFEAKAERRAANALRMKRVRARLDRLDKETGGVDEVAV
jgi:hypothetical protein